MSRKSTIQIRGTNEKKTVSITGSTKPELQDSIIQKWQSLLDTVADIVEVPSALIMKLNEETIEVFLKSNTDGNPYEEGEEAKLIYGLYCETVIGTQDKLLVPDATKSEIWAKNNPDVDINMISYLGYPINWPDGEVFGTVCLLDNKENRYSKRYEELLEHIKFHIEADLKIHFLNKKLDEKNADLEQSNILKSKLLSLISHDIRGSVAATTGLINLIIEDLENYDVTTLRPILMTLGESTSTTHKSLEDLLSWSKNETLHLQPKYEKIDLTKVILNLLKEFKSSTEAKSILVITSFDSIPAYLHTDKKMITVVLRNIISNAIKYTPQNGVIGVSINTLHNSFEIKIKDSGIGMAQPTVDSLFRYNENHGKGLMTGSSAGIGLILTKEFLDKLGGKISVESKLDEGSLFTITLEK